nr:copia protein [Tanacetum cinerariifolium]
TKWVYRNKKDERGIVVRNKARLVAQVHKQEEGIDYDEVFAPVAKVEAIRLSLAFASYMNFLVYHIDVKSAFLYDTIEEEVYVSQPPSFVDPEFPEKVYKVEKALCGLHQGPRAWYETLSTYFLDNIFHMGQIDKTLFIKKLKGDILLCKKRTVVANSTTEAEYITASHCCGQVLWIQNQMLDYGYNFMQTKIHVNNESVICVIKSPVYHSKTKHIEIRHHFIRDSYEKRRIEMVKIHTDNNEESSKHGRKIADIDVDVEINLEKVQDEAYNLDLDHQKKVLSMLDVNDEEPASVKEVLKVVTAAKLITKVVTTVGVDVNAASVQDTLITATEATKSKRSERLTDAIMKYQALKIKPLTEAQARRNMIVYLKNMAGYKMNYFKGNKSPRERSKAKKEVKVESSKREGESLEQEIAKKQKMKQETEELKKHLQIVPDDDDDDVYADATPLASKIPIVDYKIHTERFTLKETNPTSR